MNKNKITVRQNSSTGDKYFEYAREGCCLQFCDPGTELTHEICNSLFRYNEIANEWGRAHNVRTSVHLPSSFIVTIPEGFEENVCQELVKNGLSVSGRRNSPALEKKYCSIVIENYPDPRHDKEVFSFLMNRFAERLSLTILESGCQNSCVIGNSTIKILVSLLQNTLIMNIQHSLHVSEASVLIKRIQTLGIEIFHSRAIECLFEPNDFRK